jgi:2-hydroxy-3-oxopropionate reductase
MPEKVGFIGLGIMGAPMARNLIKAGYDLVVHNRTRARAEAFGQEGAEVASSPHEVAERSDIVITILPDSPDVEAVVAGPDGVLEGIRSGGLLVDMSTISPAVTRRLADRLREKGASMLDAPVSGGDVGAIAGTLSIMVGGEERDVERAMPLFRAMGRTITHAGGTGAGQVTKAANQVVTAATLTGLAEALVLGSRGGVAPEKILDALGAGLAASRVIEVKREKLLSGTFEPGFRAELHHKDLGIALSAGREQGVAMPLTALVDQMFMAMEARGWGEEDHSAVLRLIEDLSSG